MKNCPICSKEVHSFYISLIKEAFVHTNPFLGLEIYGPYDLQKNVICQNNDWVHFTFPSGENRLVKLGLTFFNDSPDAGRDCLCSVCSLPILETPIRVFTKEDKEARFHDNCFTSNRNPL